MGFCNSVSRKEEAHTWVGCFNSKPACCAAATANRDSLYVSFVSTHPSLQNRRFGSAIVRHTQIEATKLAGLMRAVLNASKAGVRVYENLCV